MIAAGRLSPTMSVYNGNSMYKAVMTSCQSELYIPDEVLMLIICSSDMDSCYNLYLTGGRRVRYILDSTPCLTELALRDGLDMYHLDISSFQLLLNIYDMHHVSERTLRVRTLSKCISMAARQCRMHLFNHFIRMSEKPVNRHMYIYKVLRSWDYISREDDAQSRYTTFVEHVSPLGSSMIHRSDKYIYNMARGANPVQLKDYNISEDSLMIGFARAGNLTMLCQAVQSRTLNLSYETSKKIMLAGVRSGNLGLVSYISSILDAEMLKSIHVNYNQSMHNNACRSGNQEMIDALTVTVKRSDLNYSDMFNEAVMSESYQLISSILNGNVWDWKLDTHSIYHARMILYIKGNPFLEDYLSSLESKGVNKTTDEDLHLHHFIA
jgi:hypothetical protein